MNPCTDEDAEETTEDAVALLLEVDTEVVE